MDKVKKFLEGYVEWLALAAGAAFAIWIAYGCIVKPPVAVDVGQTTGVTPGLIDQQIWEGSGKALEAQVKTTGAAVRVPVADFSQSVAAALKAPAPDVTYLNNVWNVDVMPPTTGGPDLAISGDDHKYDLTKVTELPTAPKPVEIAVSSGHSNTLPTADASTGTPAAANNGNAVPVAQAADKAWVSVAVKVPTAPMNDSFKQAKIPDQAQLHQTVVLRVELFRQEQDASGNWGPETQVPIPAIDALPAMPPPTGSNANAIAQERNYREFAAKNPGLILRPAFYTWVQGDKWFMPGTPNPNTKALELVADKFDPTKYLTGTIPDDLDPDEKDAVMKARKAAQLAKMKQDAADRAAKANAARGNRSNGRGGGNGPGTPAGPGGPGGPGGGSNFEVVDPTRAEMSLAMATEQDAIPAPPPAEQGMPGDVAQPQGGDTSANTVGGKLPDGMFDPATQKDFVVWAHDDTVKPGKTYRYRIRYTIANPVYGTQQLCKPAALAAEFAITSEKSDWTAPIAVESDSNFFAKGVGPKGSITFDVFKWQNGVWDKKTVNADPGDTIAGTDWTLVDVRDVEPAIATNHLLLLASDNGTLQREIKVDRQTARYHQLLVLANGGKDQQPGGMPGEPAGPGGPGGPGGEGRPPQVPTE